VETVLVKKGHEWWLEKPVVFRAHQKLVELALQELGNMELADTLAEGAEKQRQVGTSSLVTVKASAGGETLVEMTVGVTPGNETFARLEGGDTSYRVDKTLRRRFNKSPSQLRDNTVIKLDPDSVSRVRYVNSKGTFEMRRSAQTDGGDFEPVGEAIQNFDTKRAVARANALCHISARDFVDEELGSDVTGLDGDAPSVEIDATKDGTPIAVTVWVGNEKAGMRQTYMGTSLSEQVYLVPSHVTARLLVSGDEFARTDEQVAREEEARRQAELNPRMQHRHDHGKAEHAHHGKAEHAHDGKDQHAHDGHGH
jgi:hypothetical protein